MMIRPGLYWRTIRHLRFRQIVYQIINRFLPGNRLHLPTHELVGYPLRVAEPDKPLSYQRNTFTFLNQPITFLATIDWNYAGNGKLWTYQLTYFDCLNQPDMTAEEGERLIRLFIRQIDSVRDGLEPYPTSLRLVNWVKFLSRHTIQDANINGYLWAQAALVNRRLEYHLAGNHLLENGFALMMVALYVRDKRWFNKAAGLICKELTAQILADGAHYERSPMYHQILLDRLLDVLITLQADSWYGNHKLTGFLTEKAGQMLNWLESITFSTGDSPIVNDAASGVAPTTAQLQKKATLVSGLLSREATRSDGERSGYRLVRQARYELFIDTGSIGPDHQPGHAHADTFSFLLYVDGQPVIVDSGTSTYQTGERRHWERSTAAHNTVEINKTNSSEVWAGFRVGRRARVTMLENTDHVVRARHDGYRQWGITHERQWQIDSNTVTISDRLLGNSRQVRREGVARLYLHPAISVLVAENHLRTGQVDLSFTSATLPAIVLKPYDMANGFNQLLSGQCLEITFQEYLITTVTFNE